MTTGAAVVTTAGIAETAADSGSGRIGTLFSNLAAGTGTSPFRPLRPHRASCCRSGYSLSRMIFNNFKVFL
jgi:hypothetical protein